MSNYDFEAISRELFVALRGKQSQKAFNKALHFKTNRVHRWETGELIISWKDLCHVCQVKKIPLEEILKKSLNYLGPHDDPAQLLNYLLGSQSQEEIAKKLKVSRSMVSRWKNGVIVPSLPTILQFMEFSYFSASLFLSLLGGDKPLPSVQSKVTAQVREQELHVRYPWVAALILMLDKSDYKSFKKHPPGFIAKKLGITQAMEEYALQELLAIGTVDLKDSIYRVTRWNHLELKPDIEGGTHIRRYWLERALRYLSSAKNHKPENVLTYAIFNADADMLKRIRERTMVYYQDIKQIMAEDSASPDPYTTTLLSINLINLETIPTE